MEHTKKPQPVQKRGRGRPKKPQWEKYVVIPVSIMNELIRKGHTDRKIRKGHKDLNGPTDAVVLLTLYLKLAAEQGSLIINTTDTDCRDQLGWGYDKFHNAQEYLIPKFIFRKPKIVRVKNGKIPRVKIQLSTIFKGPLHFMEITNMESRTSPLENQRKPPSPHQVPDFTNLEKSIPCNVLGSENRETGVSPSFSSPREEDNYKEDNSPKPVPIEPEKKPCPFSHRFGEDLDKFNDCYNEETFVGCPIWDQCADYSDYLQEINRLSKKA